ncbi:hypothetical protein BX600DRAFT_227700 [Xylariales sp. PMI_506]|nr:hypothetical protein BX600DRAFT_227700 [Xylariales sp. PMI_506]
MEKSSLVSRNPYRSLSLSWKPSSWISTTAVPAHTTKPAATTTKRRRKARYRFFANIGLAAYLIASGTLIVLIFTYVALWTYENFTMCDEGDGSLESLEVLEEGILVNNEASGTPRQYAATLGFLARLDPLAIRIYCAMGLSMAEAKAIDIVWNLFVGRLGQFVLAYVTYRVMAVWLVDAMTRYPVPYQMVRETALPSSSGFMVLLQFLRVRSSTPIWKHCKGQIIVFAFCILYVLIFPTLNSAMSGYRAAGTPYFQAPNGDLIEIPNLTNTTANPENVRRVRFSIANGSLIGQSDPTYAWGAVISGSNETGFAQPGTPLNITTFQGLDLLQEVYRRKL